MITASLRLSGTYDSLFTSFRHAFFQVTSIATTSGYTIGDFDIWPAFPSFAIHFFLYWGLCRRHQRLHKGDTDNHHVQTYNTGLLQKTSPTGGALRKNRGQKYFRPHGFSCHFIHHIYILLYTFSLL